MKKVKLLFKDSNHASNQDIIAFLIQNLDKLNQVGILVDFRIVADAEIPSLRARGVTKLPILVVGGKKIYERSSEIKDALKQLYTRSGPDANKKFESGDTDEQLREYMESDLNLESWADDDGEEGGENGPSNMDKVIAMAAQRTKARMERSSAKYERPSKRSKDERHREKEEGGQRRSGSRKRSGGGGNSESAVERIQRQGDSPPTQDDQLMMDKFSETGISMDM